MNITTKILTIAALFAICSCAEKEITPIAPEAGKPIEFGSIDTRALVNSIDQVNAFGVSCAISNSDNSNYGSIMDNVKVERSAKSDTGWDYNPKRYWLEDSYFYFVASYPYVDGGGFQPYYDEESGTFVGYILNVDTSAQNDILIDSEYVNTSDPWNNTVKFQFGHLLTNVNFRISKDQSSANHYTITKVTLQGVSVRGEYIMMPLQNTIEQGWYSLQSGIFENVPSNGNLDGNRTISVWDNDGLLIIPEVMSTKTVELVIDYQYQLYVDESTNGEQQPEIQNKQLKVIVPTSEWVSGRRIVYTLSITDPNRIVFKNVSVEPWGNVQTGGTIIIK